MAFQTLFAVVILMSCANVSALPLPSASPVAQSCKPCHPNETNNFLASPMGRSIGTPDRSTPAGKVVHEQSGSTIAVSWKNGQMLHHLSELGLTADYLVQYQIGAGIVGHSYASVVGASLLESPVSYYKSFGWDTSPGYASSELLDFDRVLNNRCLFCHSDQVGNAGKLVAGDVALSPIGCDRCHGSASEHLRRPVPGSIVNPAKLDLAARDSICEQCHLEGVARVVKSGKSLHDFVPGQELEQTVAIYVSRNQPPGHAAVSQAEQLAISRCSIASGGKLWCGSCHDPHAPAGVKKVIVINNVCSGCHTQLAPSHPAAGSNCTSCHMPRLTPRDVAHSATTDHRILRRPAGSETRSTPTGMPELRAWRKTSAVAADARDLALAELEAARDHAYGSLAAKGEADLAAIPPEQLEGDATALAALGSVRLSRNDTRGANESFERATQLEPENPSYWLYLGIAAKQLGDSEEAIHALRRAFELEPALERAYGELAALYTKMGNTAEAKRVLDLYLTWNKQSILGRITRENIAPTDPTKASP
jgi:predicted CXXCH cytochrome family protein